MKNFPLRAYGKVTRRVALLLAGAVVSTTVCAQSFQYRVPLDEMDLRERMAVELALLSHESSFESVAVGQTQLQLLQLQNPTHRNVQGIVVEADDPFQVDAHGCEDLAPGASCYLYVGFTPTSTGASTGQVRVTFPPGKVQTFAVEGTSAPLLAGIEVENTYFTDRSDLLMSALVGQRSEAAQATITNSGLAPIDLTNVALFSGFGYFETSNDCPEQLQVGASCTLTTSFLSNEPGYHFGAFRLKSAEGHVYDIRLQGEARAN